MAVILDESGNDVRDEAGAPILDESRAIPAANLTGSAIPAIMTAIM